MSAAQTRGNESVLRHAELVERDRILHRQDEQDASSYRRQWETEAAEDHVRSAIAAGSNGEPDFETLTSKVSPLWARFPAGRRFGTVLEIGSGYGRIPLYLACRRQVSWSTYCAVDVSQTMLHRFLEYRERFGANAESRLHPICVSAEALPLEDASVDLALTSAVFLHMGKSFVKRTVAEISRTLKPDGMFVFDVSFPNALNPPNLLPRLKPRRLRSPHYLKYWTRSEIETLLLETGLASQPYTIEAGSFALLPKRVGPVPLPLARRVNASLDPSSARLRDVLTTTYSAFSAKLFA